MLRSFLALLSTVLSTVLLSSCSHGDPLPAPAPPPDSTQYAAGPDTLGAGWSRIATGLSDNLYDIFFSDSLHGWTCGTDNILRSNDGGRSWAPLALPGGNSHRFINIGAWGNGAIFASLSPEAVYTSTGSGLQVNVVTSNFGNPAVGDVFFTSAGNAFLSSGRYIWRTTNGGASIDTIYSFGVNGSGDENVLYFTDAGTGWVNRFGQLYRTSNGGLSWTLMYNGNGAPGGMQFFDAQNGFFSINERLYKTSDGGATASNVFTGPASGFGGTYKLDVHFINASTGYVSALNRIYKTTDGGQTWSNVVSAGAGIIELHFTDANHGWACGELGTVLRFAQ